MSHHAKALLLAAAGAVMVPSCSTVSLAQLGQPTAGERPILVTSGGVSEPYQSLGLVQVYRSGFFLFGWVSAPDLSLQTALDEHLIPEARRRGADAVIHVRFHEGNYTPAVKTVFLIPPLLLVPLPATTWITGELIRYVPATRPEPGATRQRS